MKGVAVRKGEAHQPWGMTLAAGIRQGGCGSQAAFRVCCGRDFESAEHHFTRKGLPTV
jgi:hypothetical protein